MADLLERQLRDARRARQTVGMPLSDTDSEDEDEDDDGDVDETAAEEANDEIRASAGPCVPPANWTIVPTPPATSQGEWKSKCKSAFWKQRRSETRRLAHVWACGWDFASFRRAHASGDDWWFYYGSVKEEITHHLLLSDYGIYKTWVILEKGRRGRDRPATTTAPAADAAV